MVQCVYIWAVLFLRNSREIMYQASPTFHTESDKKLDRAWEQGYTSRLWHMWKCGNCLALYNLPELVPSLSAWAADTSLTITSNYGLNLK